MSTDPTGQHAGFDPAARYRLNPSVALRPESFGALAYHFGTRRMSFMKEPGLVDVVRRLADYDTVLDALTGCEITAGRREHYLAALRTLAESDLIVAA